MNVPCRASSPRRAPSPCRGPSPSRDPCRAHLGCRGRVCQPNLECRCRVGQPNLECCGRVGQPNLESCGRVGQPNRECCGRVGQPCHCGGCNCGGALIGGLFQMTLFIYGFATSIEHCAATIIAVKLGTDQVFCYWLTMVIQAIMIFVAPLIGRYADIYCPCAPLRLSYAACVLSYTFMLAYNCIWYYLSFMMEILFFVYLGTQMVLSDLTCVAHRTMALAIIGFIFRLGATIGAFVATMFVEKMGAWYSVLLMLIGMSFCFIMVMIYFPCVRLEHQECCPQRMCDLDAFMGVVTFLPIPLMLMIKLITSIPVIAIWMLVPSIMARTYNVNDDKEFYNHIWTIKFFDLGMHLACLILMKIMRSDVKQGLFSLAMIAISATGLITVQKLGVFMYFCASLITGGIILDNTITSVLTKCVRGHNKGFALGLYAMVHIGVLLIVPVILKSQQHLYEQSCSYLTSFACVALGASVLSFLVFWGAANL